MRWFNSILYVAETSVAQESALERAVSLTKNNQASLTVIDVVTLLKDELIREGLINKR